MSVIYIESFSGLSGDMFLGALASLTDSFQELEKLPGQLNLNDGKIEIKEVDKNGIVCKHVHIVDLNTHHEHNDNHGHHHHHNHDHNHSHEHTHTREHHHNAHRHLSDINEVIENGLISDNAKKIAKDIFQIIGKSESKIHNIPLEEIHFHEVSGVDSILDIVGCAVMLDKLKVTKTYATAVCTGFGFVDTEHGKLPVPAPATADILSGLPTYSGDEKGERVTPTGAAILKYLEPEFDVPVLTKTKTVYGPGSKDFIAPNVLRISTCEETKQLSGTYVIETNIDDMSNELLGADFQDGLFAHGASDFFTSPIQMKKGRQGVLLSCSVPGKNVSKLSNYIFDNTSTIGVRYYPVKGRKLNREIKEVETPYGTVQVKVVETPTGMKKAKIEYDDLKRISKEIEVPIYKLQNEINIIINTEL